VFELFAHQRAVVRLFGVVALLFVIHAAHRSTVGRYRATVPA
jgi:hypothetical protein